MPVSEWIKKAREENGLTQQQLADKSGFSKKLLIGEKDREVSQ